MDIMDCVAGEASRIFTGMYCIALAACMVVIKSAGKALLTGRPVRQDTVVDVVVLGAAGSFVLLWGTKFSGDVFASLALVWSLAAYVGSMIEFEMEDVTTKASADD